eukprot:scaffold31971_cov135-Isochrysis_galbana.AAC.1
MGTGIGARLRRHRIRQLTWDPHKPHTACNGVPSSPAPRALLHRTTSAIRSSPSAATMRARTTVPGASGMVGMRTVPSMSIASNSVRPTASVPSMRSTITRRMEPT